MRVLAFTSIRSEYDLMSGLYALLDSEPGVDFRLLVSGAHLSPRYGRSVDGIHRDGLPVLAEIETLVDSDSAASRLKTASNLLAASLDVVSDFAPDLIVYAGDREDVLVAAMIAGFLGVPSVHFYGGDHAKDGHIDNPVRHAVSKLTTMHMVSAERHRERLLALGEPDSRIRVIGSVALDKFKSEPHLDQVDLLKGIGAKEGALSSPLAVFIFHPLQEEIAASGDIVDSALKALVTMGYHVMVGSPNTDPGNFAIQESIDKWRQHSSVTVYGNLARREFINLLRSSELIIGNSSAGLLESASLKMSAINIGNRQKGRLHSGNVVFVQGDYDSIMEGLATVRSEEYKEALRDLKNVYGDGDSAARALDVILGTDFRKMLKKCEDPLDGA